MTHFEEKTRKTEKIMNDLMDYLKTFEYNQNFMQEIHISDRRVISSIGESSYTISLIKKWYSIADIVKKMKLNIEYSNDKKIYDILITSAIYPDIIIPCSIKVSKFKSFDPIYAQNVLELIISGMFPEIKEEEKTDETIYLLDFLKQKAYKEPIDFYYICINKSNMKNSYHTSLLTIKNFKLHSTKLLQCNWGVCLKEGRTCLFEPTKEDLSNDKKRKYIPREYRSYKDSVLNVLKALDYCYDMNEKELKKSKQKLKEQYKDFKKVVKNYD